MAKFNAQLFPQHLTSGIYTITNVVNNRVYVGQSVSISTRWNAHKSTLNNGTHHNKDLLQDWSLFGKENFCFRFIESVEPDPVSLNRAEAYWIDWYQSLEPSKGYNKVSFAFPNSDQIVIGEHCFLLPVGQWDILVRKIDHYFFATGIASTFNKSVSDFVRQKSVQQFNSLISNDPKSKYKGTWIDFGLLGKFAAWADPAFEVFARRTMMQISLTSNIDVMKNVERALNNGL